MVENFDFSLGSASSRRLWIFLTCLVLLVVTIPFIPQLDMNRCYAHDRNIFSRFERIQNETKNCVFQDHRHFPNVVRNDFVELDGSFVGYETDSEKMLVLVKLNQSQYKSVKIRVSDEVPFKYLIEKHDDLCFLMYCHPNNPVYDVPIDMVENVTTIGECYFTVLRIVWHSGDSDEIYRHDIKFKSSDRGVGWYFGLSFAAAIFTITLMAKKSGMSEILAPSFFVTYLVSIILYDLKVGFSPLKWEPILTSGRFGTQAEYGTFILLSSWAMLIAFEMGLGTKREEMSGNERSLLLTFTTLITLVSVVVTFLGGLLTPLAPTIAVLNIPARMAVVLFGAILGLNSFLLGILGKGVGGMYTWTGRIFVVVLGSLFSIIAFAYTGGYYYSIFFAIGTVVSVGGFLFLRYDKSSWRPRCIPIVHTILRLFAASDRQTLNYADILEHSWNTILENIRRGEVTLESEEDLRCHLFHQCVASIAAAGLKLPFPIHAEKEYLDLVLDEGDVIAELKFSKKDEGGYTSQKESILRDLNKLKERKAKSAYFGIVSEVGYFFDPESENCVDFRSLGFSDRFTLAKEYHCLLAKLST